MTFGEFLDKELPCEECPLYQENMCSGGVKCYGGMPIEPPCCFVDADQDIEEWVRQKNLQILAYEEVEDIQARVLEQKRERQRKRKETTAQMKSYCWKERAEIKGIKKRIKAFEKAKSFAECMAIAFNSTNQIFGYEERKQVNPKLTSELDNLNEQLKTAEEKYKAKRKEFYSKNGE